MSSGARLGFLVSSPLVGTLAAATSLRAALAVVVGMAALAVLTLESAPGRAVG